MKFFKGFFKEKEYEQKGLCVSLSELIAQRKNVAKIFYSQKNKSTTLQSGNVKSAFKGRGLEFEEIRQYNVGDDVRDIDWRVTARKQAPYSKIYNEEKDRKVFALLDLSASMRFGSKKELKSVTAAKVCATFGWMALEKKDKFGMMIFDGKNHWFYKPQNHKQSFMAMLKKVADVSCNVLNEENYINKTFLNECIKKLEKHIKSKAIVFVISDFYNIQDEKFDELKALALKSNLTLVNVFDVLEEVAPQQGEYMVQNNGISATFSATEEFGDLYKDIFANKRAKLKEFCIKHNCNYIEIRNDILINRQIIL